MPNITQSSTKENEVVTKIDESGQTIYIGVAKLGAADSDAKWQIRRLSTSSGLTEIQYADGDRRYDNIWNDRASLVYTN